MKRVLQIDRRQIAKWSLIVLCSGWIVGAAWFQFMQTTPVTNAYTSYERQLAKCRTKSTSQARYDCTSQLMLAKDNAAFDKTLVVLVPPLWLFGAYVVVDRILRRREEAKKGRAAFAASQKRMAEWHEFLNGIKARKAAAQQKTAAQKTPGFPAKAANPIVLPPHLAKRRQGP